MHMIEHLDIFICPACGGNLKIESDTIKCLGCYAEYQIKNNIPLFFVPKEKNKITDIEKSFYEETPFPNYEELESIDSLLQKAQKGIFARLLNEQTPFNIRVLEVGCGTGQLSNFLGITHRFVFGTDMCFNSLKLAENFREKNHLNRVGFYQMNLFKPIFKEESFPLVICNGVLHHTDDPFSGFQSIAKLVKKGGYIIIGLYNRYGRIMTDIRRAIFKISGNRFKFLDSRLRNKNSDEIRKLTWFKDQYKNPYESRHTFGEILEWFDKTGFEFINSVPKMEILEILSEKEDLFKQRSKGNMLSRFFAQANLLLTGSKEGGFFLIIGKKKF